MSAYIRRRPPVKPTPAPVYSQDQQRDRRRKRMSVVYTGDFALSEEIAAIVGPLADRVSGQRNPRAFATTVDEVVEAVHELVSTVVGWLAAVDARQRTKHMESEPSTRAYAVRTLVDLAPRPARPEITDDMLASGAWAAVLVAMAGTVDAELSDLLKRSWPPDAPELRSPLSRSELLERLLRETVDMAALTLSRRLDRAAPEGRRAQPDPVEELRRLGVSI